MGVLLALMVFLFPLGLPLVTLGVFVAVFLYTRGSPAATLGLGIGASVALGLLLGPGVQRGGAGSFALPWWLLDSGAEYYVWQYLGLCGALAMLSFALATLRELLAERRASSALTSSSSPLPGTADVVASAIQARRSGQPVTQLCPACETRLFVNVWSKPPGRDNYLKVSCRCGQCDGNLPL